MTHRTGVSLLPTHPSATPDPTPHLLLCSGTVLGYISLDPLVTSWLGTTGRRQGKVFIPCFLSNSSESSWPRAPSLQGSSSFGVLRTSFHSVLQTREVRASCLLLLVPYGVLALSTPLQIFSALNLHPCPNQLPLGFPAEPPAVAINGAEAQLGWLISQYESSLSTRKDILKKREREREQIK